MILLIDNYDSFTYNLVHYLGELGAACKVVRNDAISVENAIKLKPDAIVLSPGPGIPEQSGICLELVRAAADRTIPLLGVCLGHQVIARFFGGQIKRAQIIMHGKIDQISHKGCGLFKGLPSPVKATRYHSLIADVQEVLSPLEVTALSSEGSVMGLQHRDYPICGVQFHPESIGTAHGHRLLANFLSMNDISTRTALPANSLPHFYEKTEQSASLPAAINTRSGNIRSDDKGDYERSSPSSLNAVFRPYLHKILRGEDLDQRDAEQAFSQIMSGSCDPVLIAAFLVALRQKGESVAEITGATKILRDNFVPISAPEDAIDTCGTGGDGHGTLNISTVSAIVAAACGAIVAKHGNRNLSSLSGSSQVLAELGVNIQAELPLIEKSIKGVGIGFMMATRHHKAMKHVAPVRAQLATRTIFNLLGPLANPAGVKRQLVGVFDSGLVRPLASVLINLGVEKAWVVHGYDGLDELTTTDKSLVAECVNGEMRVFEIEPTELGLKRATISAIKGGDPAFNALAIRNLLSGEKGSYRDIVLLNTAAALIVADVVKDLEAGIQLAANAIDKGQAREKLNAMVRFSHGEHN